MERISSRALQCFTNFLTNHTIGWDNSKIIYKLYIYINLKLSPLIGVTTSAFAWRLGILTPPTLL